MRATSLRLNRTARSVFIALLLPTLCASAAYGQSATTGRAGSTHVVRPGDTLWDLSRRYMNTPNRWPEIQRDNVVPVPQRMQPGQVLTVGAVATVADVSGEVHLTRAGTWSAPEIGAALEPEDLLSTGRSGFLTLAFADGSRVVVPSSSTVRLMVAHGRSTQLELLNGRIESYVEKQKARDFEIRTRTFALGVKGTHFRVRANSETSTLEVLEGTVVATPLSSDERSLTVGAGKGTALTARSELIARSLLPAPEQRSVEERNVVVASDIDGAKSYQLQLAQDPNFLGLKAEAAADRPRFALASGLAPGFYHTRLSAFDDQSIEGLTSSGLVFVPSTGKLQEDTVRPVADDNYEIRWTPRQSKRHTFEVSKDPDFATLLVSESGNFPVGVTFGPLKSPDRYFWRCREEAERGSSPQAAWGGSFEVPPR